MSGAPGKGMDAGSYEEVILWNKEHIVVVTSSRNAFIHSVTFYTNQNRKFHFGTKSGILFTAYGKTYGKVLSGIIGKKQKQGIYDMASNGITQWCRHVSLRAIDNNTENQEETANNQQVIQPTSYNDTNTNS